MKLMWEKITDNTWVGRSAELRFAQTVEYSEVFNSYFVDGTMFSYKTLKAAKIAAARTALRLEAVI